MAWTDERLDDLARRMDAGFESVGNELRELRTEIREQRSELGGRIDAQGAELGGRIDAQGVELRAEIEALRVTLLRVGGGMMAGLVGVIAAILLGG